MAYRPAEKGPSRPFPATDATGGGGSGQNPNTLRSPDQQPLTALEQLQAGGLINLSDPEVTFLPGHSRHFKDLPSRIPLTALTAPVNGKLPIHAVGDEGHDVLFYISQEVRQIGIENMLFLYSATVRDRSETTNNPPTNPADAIKELRHINTSALSVIRINLVVLKLQELGLISPELNDDIQKLDISVDNVNILAEQFLATKEPYLKLLEQQRQIDELRKAIAETDVVDVFKGMRSNTYDRAVEVAKQRSDSGITNQVELLNHLATQPQYKPGEAIRKVENYLSQLNPDIAADVRVALDTIPFLPSIPAQGKPRPSLGTLANVARMTGSLIKRPGFDDRAAANQDTNILNVVKPTDKDGSGNQGNK